MSVTAVALADVRADRLLLGANVLGVQLHEQGGPKAVGLRRWSLIEQHGAVVVAHRRQTRFMHDTMVGVSVFAGMGQNEAVARLSVLVEETSFDFTNDLVLGLDEMAIGIRQDLDINRFHPERTSPLDRLITARTGLVHELAPQSHPTFGQHQEIDVGIEVGDEKVHEPTSAELDVIRVRTNTENARVSVDEEHLILDVGEVQKTDSADRLASSWGTFQTREPGLIQAECPLLKLR